jgi:hypothetical protein
VVEIRSFSQKHQVTLHLVDRDEVGAPNDGLAELVGQGSLHVVLPGADPAGGDFINIISARITPEGANDSFKHSLEPKNCAHCC